VDLNSTGLYLFNDSIADFDNTYYNSSTSSSYQVINDTALTYETPFFSYTGTSADETIELGGYLM